MSRKRLDITDQIFHRLQVIVTDWYKTKETGQTHWFCQCEDNNIVSVSLNNLRSGNTQSCGCLRRELSFENREDLSGQLFTRWFVDSYNPEKSKEMGKPYWNVTCTNDGNKGCVSGNNLKHGQSKSCGCLHKESVSKRGKNCPAWNGGITSLCGKIRNSTEYKEFVQKTLKKVNYTCQLTKEIGGELNVHHKKGFAKILEENNITTREEAENCKELWNESNVIVLSEKWHMGIKTDNPNAFHRIYGNFNFTEEDFYTWFNEFSLIEKVFGN